MNTHDAVMPLLRPLVVGLLVALPLWSPAAAATGPDRTADAPPDVRRAAAPCSALDTSEPGIGRRAVRLGNVVDDRGPVPGLFVSAREAAQAYVAYFNSRSDVCGRRVVLDVYDSRTDAAQGDRIAGRMCERDLAAVASMSAFDNGGATRVEACGLPDLRVQSVTSERRACSTCLAVRPTSPGVTSRAAARHLAEVAPDAVARAGFLSVAGGDAETEARASLAAAEAEGWSVVYEESVPPLTASYVPYVLELQSQDVRLLAFFGGLSETLQLQEDMRQVGYDPEILLLDEVVYSPAYVAMAGEDADGVTTRLDHVLLEDRSDPELRRYRTWLDRVRPGATPDAHGLFAWSATRLMLREMVALRGDLDRSTLLGAIAGTRTWDGRGLHAPQAIRAQEVSRCELLAAYDGARWVQVTPGGFVCAPLADATPGP